MMLSRYGDGMNSRLHGQSCCTVRSRYRRAGAKRLRLGRHRRPHPEALERVKQHLTTQYLQKGADTVTAEIISIELNLDIGCVKKAFMALNRAGFMSQAVHQEHGRRCSEDDWVADVYTLQLQKN